MIPCQLCQKKPAAEVLKVCADCLKNMDLEQARQTHPFPLRKKFGLPEIPPTDPEGRKCNFCSNECQPGPQKAGFCGLRKNINGNLKYIFSEPSALAYMYLDPLPTNCCAAWFCQGSKEKGNNLAFFFYGCNFDCLFCQNSSHKRIHEASLLTEKEVIQAALLPGVRCVCFFGGSPEPQLPFAIRVSEKIIKESKNQKHICWEWNGCGHPALAKKAAELSLRSGGTVKFDLKAYHPNIGSALCGTDFSRAYQNFSHLAKKFPEKNLLTATTLLVPYYVDKTEVSQIAQFIARASPDIPYSLLAFHPDYLLMDLPVTPQAQAKECYQEACRYLSHVDLGNKHLLGL